MVSSGAVTQPRSPTDMPGDEVVATVRIRTKELDRYLEESRFRSQEEFIRAAGISRTAWNALFDEDKKRVDLRVLAAVLKTLNKDLADVLEYDPDEKIG